MYTFMDPTHAVLQEKLSSLILSIPEHRSGNMESRWDYMRHFVTDGRQVNLDVNLEDRTVELWIHRDTPDPEDLERSAKFIGAVLLGFSTRVAMSLLHNDDFVVETWNIEEMIMELKRPVDAKRLYRNIRETIMAIEDSTITKIVMVKSVLHVLGSSAKVSAAKEYIRHIISQYFLISADIQESPPTTTKPCYNRPEHTPMGWTILMMQRGIKPGIVRLTQTFPSSTLPLDQPLRSGYFISQD